MHVLQAKIEEIIIKKRVRKNLGDIGSLMKSMKTYGLLNPIIINPNNELIAGHRRLEAARRLGWETITAAVMSKNDELQKLELEIEENLHRRNLTPDELAEGFLRLDKLKNPGLFKRIWKAICACFAKIFGKKN
jgi:ParB family chromosome partitioning protein